MRVQASFGHMVATLVLGIALVLSIRTSHASTFRWSSADDVGTLDPHALNVELTTGLLSQIYEPLVTRDQHMQLAPSLAVSWMAVESTRWRFKLRSGVQFQDGTPFTADDVVYSIDRARLPASAFRPFAGTIKNVSAIEPLEVEITTTEPDPILVPKLTSVLIMSKTWAEAHSLGAPQDMSKTVENFASWHTNGTGPYRLRLREPDVRTELEANPTWWGKRDGNVTEVVYRPIANAATRIATLLSGELDLVIDPPLQDVDRLRQTAGITLMQTNEFRTVYFGMDVYRDQLLYSDVTGTNPFKDRRVRQALYQAIDIDAIQSRIMHGFSVISGTSIAPGNTGWTPELDRRLPYDPAASKRLLAEAGYPNGFGFTMDCPNNRYIADEQICNAAAAMWARVGLRAEVRAAPRQVYFPRTYKLDVSLYLLGINSPFMDAIYGAEETLATRTAAGDGTSNFGRYSNPDVDRLIALARGDMDEKRRTATLTNIFGIERSDIAIIPLHNQVLIYALRSNVSMTQRSDNRVEVRWITVN